MEEEFGTEDAAHPREIGRKMFYTSLFMISEKEITKFLYVFYHILRVVIHVIKL